MPRTSSPRRWCCAAGYGLFYGAFENRGGNPSLGYNYPFQFTLVYQSPNDTAPNRLPDGSLVGLDARDRLVLDPVNVNANGLTLRGVEFDYKTPRYHNYNVTLQTEIMENHSVEVGYVGTQGNHLETFTGMNNVTQLLPPGTNPQNYVPWPDFARGSLWVRTVGVSSYDSLQTKFIRRYHKGLQFLLSYTLSDSKTNAGDSLSGGVVGGLRAPDVVGYDLKNDIGLSAFHTKHALVFSGNYDLPGSGRWLGGWRTNWVLSMYSGQAQTINCTVTTAAGSGTGGGGNGCYALLVGDPYAGAHNVDQFYNPAAFRDPAPVATIGQTDFSPLGGPRSQVTGPPMRQIDMGFARQFRVSTGEELRISRRDLQSHEHGGIQSAGERGAELQRSEKLREYDDHAKSAAPGSIGREVLLVAVRRRDWFLIGFALALAVRADGAALQPLPAPPKPSAPPATASKKPTEAAAVERRLVDAARRNPDSFDAQYQLASFYVQKGRLDVALPHLKRACTIDPTHYDSGHDLALALLEMGKLDEARAQIARMIAANDSAELHNLLGDVDERAGNLAGAAEEYQRAAQMAPTEEHLFDWGNNLLQLRALEEATQVFAAALARHPRSARLYVGLGIARYSRGQYEDAVSAFCQAADLAPSDPRPYQFLGEMYGVAPALGGEITSASGPLREGAAAERAGAVPLRDEPLERPARGLAACRSAPG